MESPLARSDRAPFLRNKREENKTELNSKKQPYKTEKKGLCSSWIFYIEYKNYKALLI